MSSFVNALSDLVNSGSFGTADKNSIYKQGSLKGSDYANMGARTIDTVFGNDVFQLKQSIAAFSNPTSYYNEILARIEQAENKAKSEYDAELDRLSNYKQIPASLRVEKALAKAQQVYDNEKGYIALDYPIDMNLDIFMKESKPQTRLFKTDPYKSAGGGDKDYKAKYDKTKARLKAMEAGSVKVPTE